MKLAEKLHLQRLFPKDRKGVALITVLTVMSLTTILILTFFSLASSEHRASYTYANGLQAQQVGEEAINLVIAQIREATTVGTKVAWASQPGSIRQWGDNGRPLFAYKLYSDDRMKIDSDGDGWSDFRNDFADMDAWSNRPDHYVDLNEPVIRGEKVYYPIVHPAASSIPKWPQPLGAEQDQDGVEGFGYNELPGRRLSDPGPMGEKAARIAGSRSGHVAMPVKWIYQLADGTLGVLAEGNSGNGYAFKRIAGGGDPSAENRIVARFAFWADDETTKLNVNTAAGGLAWDVPKAGGELDMNMGKYQPAQHEWQRYPGHPASTHLIPVLAPGVLDIVNDRDAMEMLFKVVPRIVGGGSESGTRAIDTRRKEEENGLIADRDPLFPTVDDIIMRSDRKAHEFPDAKGRPIPATELSEYLERSKFFLTANSRAPETNMFNLPRISIWPIYDAAYGDPEYKTRLTPFDRLMHYCASMGKQSGSNYPRYEYIFKRKNADSTKDDYENIKRNQDLYAYLRRMLESNMPGYGGSFSNKYQSQEYLQILTEIFDYIRSTNLHDDSIYEDFNDAFSKDNNNKARTYTNPRDKNNTQIGHKGHGQVVPIKIGNTKGMGRFYSLGSVQIQVISCAEAHDRMLPKNFGATAYRASDRKDPSNPYGGGPNPERQALFANFPPHPLGFVKPGDPRNPGGPYLAIEPAWLRDLRTIAYPPLPDAGPTDYIIRYEAAFDPNTWNWQLAFLDPVYAGAVMTSPTTAKFMREFLSVDNFRDGVTRLQEGEQLVQAGLFFNLFTPSIGWGSINPDMEIEIDSSGNFNFDTVAGTGASPGSLSPGRFLGLTSGTKWIFSTNRMDSCWGGRRYGGLMPMEYLLTVPRESSSRNYPGNFGMEIHNTFPPKYDLTGIKNVVRNTANALNGYSFMWPGFVIGYQSGTLGGPSRLSPIDRGWDTMNGIRSYSGDPSGLDSSTQNAYRYDLVTAPFKISGGGYENAPTGSVLDRYFNPGEVQFFGGRLTFRFYHGGKNAEFSAPNGSIASHGVNGGDEIQKIEIDIPQFKFDSGNNRHPQYGRAPLMFDYRGTNNFETYRSHLGGYYNEFYSLEGDSFSLLERNSLSADPGNPLNTPMGTTADRRNNTRLSSNENKPKFTSLAVPSGRFGHTNVYDRPGLFSPNDIVQSIEIAHGDARIVAGRAEIARGDKIFEEHRYYGKRTLAHSATSAVGSPYVGASIEADYLIRTDLPLSKGITPYAYPSESRVPLPFGGREKSDQVQLYGDFDNGSGLMIDGPYINKPDEGNVHSLKSKYMGSEGGFWESRRNYGEFPYFNRDDIQETGGPAYFSPNRLVSGPGMFGSLPTGVLTNKPWRTLLFRPATTGTVPGFRKHPGGDTPPDHLLMDLFWMPVVEPYAISEPLSTAGKININFDIVPFLHIQRSTALRGIFRSEMMVCIPKKWHSNYKHNHGRGQGYHWRDKPYGGELQGRRLRSVIAEAATIEPFFERFDNGKKIFKSATEICEMHLVSEEVSDRLNQPKGKIGSYTPSIAQLESGKFWQDHSLVGDNSRERPYTNIQTRLTSKSNTFLVHYRAQVLKQAKRDSSAEYSSWNPETDTVQAEYRGSSIVERYVDPNAEDIPDLAKALSSGSGESLDKYYRFRVVNPRRFAP